MTGLPNGRPLFRAFEQLADGPGGVAKLRELILQLAVQGRLVDQRETEQNDKTWHVFVDEFDARVYSYNPGSPPPFEIPDAWRWVCLDDVADYRAAKKVEPSAIADDAWVLNLEELEKDTSRIIEFKTFAEKSSTSTKAAFLPGDVLYGKLRPYLNKVVVAPKPGYCTTEIVPIRSRGVIRPDYLCLYLRSPVFVGYATAKSYGMKMPRLGTDDAQAAEIALPPPAEQARIVAKVDELMALCDALEARQTTRNEARRRLHAATLHHVTAARSPAELAAHWSRLRTHFDPLHATPDSIPTLRQTILTLAIQGRLVAQNAADGSTAAELALTEKERARLVQEGAVRRSKPLPDADEVDFDFDLPSGWCAARFGSVAMNIEAGSSPNCYSHRREGEEWGVLKISAVSWDEFDPDENKALPPNVESQAGRFFDVASEYCRVGREERCRAGYAAASAAQRQDPSSAVQQLHGR